MNSFLHPRRAAIRGVEEEPLRFAEAYESVEMRTVFVLDGLTAVTCPNGGPAIVMKEVQALSRKLRTKWSATADLL